MWMTIFHVLQLKKKTLKLLESPPNKILLPISEFLSYWQKCPSDPKQKFQSSFSFYQ